MDGDIVYIASPTGLLIVNFLVWGKWSVQMYIQPVFCIRKILCQYIVGDEKNKQNDVYKISVIPIVGSIAWSSADNESSSGCQAA